MQGSRWRQAAGRWSLDIEFPIGGERRTSVRRSRAAGTVLGNLTDSMMMVIVMITNDDHHDHGDDDDGHGDDWAVGTDYATSHPPIILQTHGWVIRSMG